MIALLSIFLAAIFTNNIALTYLLGMCPFVSLSRNLKTSLGMGASVIFVVTITAAVNWIIYRYVLVPTNSELLEYIIFIIVIAGTVQLLEMIMEKFFPTMQAVMGIFLPLITVNCMVLAVSLFMVLRDYSFIKTLFFAVGSAVGWVLAMVIVAAIREKLELIGSVPEGLKGAGITMIIAGIIALAFLGFAGMVSIQ
ncbi:MAG: electron transport complex protein RnfA [Spirochaetota bacterium]